MNYINNILGRMGNIPPLKKYTSYYGSLDAEPSRDYQTARHTALAKVNKYYDDMPDGAYDKALQSLNYGSKDYNVRALKEQFEEFMKYTDEPQHSIFGFDLETFGAYGEGSTELEQKLFGISEASIVEKTEVNGEYKYNTHDFLFGIGAEDEVNFRTLLDRAASNYHELTQAERSTVERLTRYAGDLDERFEKLPSGFYRLKSITEGDKYDFQMARRGLENLRIIGDKQGFNTDKGKEQLKQIRGLLAKADDTGKLLSFNGKKFDEPFLNEAFSRAGIEPIKFKNHLDMSQVLEATYGGRLDELHNEIRFHNGADTPISRALGRLENFAKSFDIQTSSHLARDDAKFTLDMLDMEVYPLEPLKDVLDFQFRNISDDDLSLTDANKSERRIIARKALAIEPNSLDFVQDASTGKVKNYTDWSFKRNHIYEAINIGSVDIDDNMKAHLNKIGYQLQENQEKLYFMRVKDAAQNLRNNEIVTIFKNSHEELELPFQENLEIIEFVKDNAKVSSAKQINQAMIDKTVTAAVKDNARRAFDGMFETSGQGFSYAKNMYETYDELQEAFKNEGGITAEELRQMVHEGEFSRGNKVYNAEDMNLFSKLKSKNGLLIESRAENFTQMYGMIADSNEVMGDMIKAIEIKGGDEYNKTLALSRSYAELKDRVKQQVKFDQKKILENMAVQQEKYDTVDEKKQHYNEIEKNMIKKGLVSKGDIARHNEIVDTFDPKELEKLIDEDKLDDIVNNRTTKEMTISDLRTLDIINPENVSESRRISLSSPKEIGWSLYNYATNIADVKVNRSGTLPKEFTLDALKKIAKNLESRYIIDSERLDELETLRDPSYYAQALGKEVSNTYSNVVEQLTPGQMFDIKDIAQAHEDLELDLSHNENLESAVQSYGNFHVKEIKTLNSDGFKIYPEESLNQFANRIGDASAMAARNSDEVNIIESKRNLKQFGMDNKLSKYGGLSDEMMEHLIKSYGYTHNNISSLNKALFGKGYGIISNEKVQGLLYEKKVDGEDKLFMSLTNDKNYHSMYRDIISGEDPTNSVTLELPKVHNVDGSRVLKYGNSEKLITSEVNFFYGDLRKYTKHEAEEFRFGIKDTVDDVFSAFTKVHFDIKEMLDTNQFKDLERRIRNNMLRPILEGAGPSGYVTVNQGERTVRAYRPNVSDLLTSTRTKVGDLVNFIPAIYETIDKDSPDELKDFRQEIIDNFGKGDVSNTNYKMRKWVEQIVHDKKPKKFEELSIQQKAWFVSRFSETTKPGQLTIGEAIMSFRGKSNYDKPDGQFAQLEDFIGKANMLIKDEKAAQAVASTANIFEYATYGFMNELSRPLSSQSMAFHALDVKEMDAKKDLLAEADIKVGQSIVTDKYYEDYLKKTGMKYESGIMGNVKIMNTGAVLDAIDNVNPYEFLAQVNMSSGIGYTMTDFNKVKSQMIAIGDTHMQHVLLNPLIKNEIWNEPELMTMRIGQRGEFKADDKVNLKIGQTLKKGTFLGFETDDRDIRHGVVYDKMDGVITDIKDGRIIVKPLESQIDEIKTIFGNVEKGVASVANTDKRLKTLTQEFWNTAFGKHVSAVADFEFTKHESMSQIIGSDINILGDVAIQKGEQREFISNLNKFMNLEGKVVDDGGTNRFVISGNPNAKGGYIEGFKDLMKQYSDKEGYKEAIEKSRKENTVRTIISRGHMSEMHPTDAGIEDFSGKGMKVTDRLMQVAGIQTGENADDFYTMVNGKRVKKLQPVLDLWKNEIERGYEVRTRGYNHEGEPIRKTLETDYAKAKSDLSNIASSFDVMNGGEPNPNLRIKELNLDELKPITRKLGARDLENTIYESTKDGEALFDLYNMNLPSNVKVTNPFTGERVNQVTLPHLRTHDFLNESQRATADFIKSVWDVAEGNTSSKHNTPKELQQNLQKSYEAMISKYAEEFGDKNGSLSSMLSGRLAHSGQGLAGTVIAPEFTKESNIQSKDDVKELIAGKREAELRNTEFNKGAIVNKDGKTHLYDTVFTSESMLKDMGVNFEEIGADVRHRAMSNKDAEALNFLKEHTTGLYDTSENIGRAWAKEKGIMGTVVRYPTFLDTSVRVGNIRMSDSVEGRRIHIQSWTGAALNADIDADRLSLWLNVNDKGGLKNDASEKALKEVYEAQSTNNGKHLESSYDDYVDVDGKKSRNLEEYEKYAKAKIYNAEDYKELLPEGEEFTIDKVSNKLQDSRKRTIGAISRANKAAIGYVSTPNYNIRDIALNELTNTGSEVDDKHLSNIIDFTNRTEQKLIDTKHMKKFDIPTYAQIYKDALNNIASGEDAKVQAGTESMTRVLTEMNIYKPEEAKEMKSAIGSLTRLFSSSTAQTEWTSPLRSAIKSSNVNDQVKAIKAILENPQSYGNTSLTESSIKIITEAIGKTPQGDRVSLSLGGESLDRGMYLYNQDNLGEIESNVYKIKDYGYGKRTNTYFADIQAGKNVHRIHADSNEELNVKLNQNFVNVSDKNPGLINKMKGLTVSNKSQREALREQVTVKATDELIANTQTVEDMRRNALTSDFFAHNNNYSRSNFLMHFKEANIPKQELEDLRSHIRNLGDLSESKLNAYRKANEEFFNHPLKIETASDFINDVSELKANGYVNDEIGSRMITAMNEALRKEGAEAGSKKRNDIVLNAIHEGKTAMDAPQINESNINSLMRDMRKSWESKTEQAPDVSISNMQREIADTVLYDTNYLETQLKSNAEKLKSAPELSEYINDDAFHDIIRNKAVDQPLQNIKAIENAKRTVISNNYAQLLKKDNYEGQLALDWKPKGYIQSLLNNKETAPQAQSILQDSKVSFGRYVGQRIGDLNIDSLKSIASMSTDGMDDIAHVNSIKETQARVGMYFKTLDDLDNQVVPPSINNLDHVKVELPKVMAEHDIKLPTASDIGSTLKSDFTMTRKVLDDVIPEVGKVEGKMHGGVKSLVLAGAALGLAGIALSAGKINQAPLQPERKPKGAGAPGVDGNYDEPVVHYKQQPKTVRMQENPNSGLNLKVRAKLNGQVNSGNVTDAVHSTVQSEVQTKLNMNVNTRDDSKPVSSGWLTEQFKNLLR